MDILGKLHTTAIGSLPFTNVEASHELIRENIDIPHWAQLPQLGHGEGFIEQYVRPLVEIGLVQAPNGKSPYFDTEREDFLDLLTQFYSLYLAAEEGDQKALAKFGFISSGAAGFFSFVDKVKDGYYGTPAMIKGQVSGPITLGLQVTDANRRSSYYDEQLRDVLTKTLAMHAKWQAELLIELGYPVLIFIDDPGLYSLGMSTHITLTKEDISEDLNQVIQAIKGAGALAGSHTCASTDWSMLFELELQVVNFDAYQYFSSLSVYPESINSFLAKGGVLAFGIIPTNGILETLSVDDLVDLFKEQVDILASKGVDRKRLLEQSIITPSCGTGTLSPELAKLVYSMTREVSRTVREWGNCN